jgi:hypothetical protein
MTMTILRRPFAPARHLSFALLGVLASTGCGDATDTASESSNSTVVPPAVAPDAERADPALDSSGLRTDEQVDSIVAAIRACPRDGRWHPCSIEQRFGLAGLRVVPMDSALGIPGLTEPVSSWQVGRQQLRVAFFATEAAATAALGRFDSARAAPRGDTTVRWPDRPTLLRSANVIAVLVGGTDRAIERASNALLAGPPQP